MMIGKPLHSQVRPLLFSLAFGYIPILLLLFIAWLIALKTNVPFGDLTRDVTTVAGLPFYAGVLSTIGILLWCGTSSVCLLTFGVMHTRSSDSKIKCFFLCAALLSSLLMFDDAVLIHERIAPRYLGISENKTFIIYIILALSFFFSFIDIIIAEDYLLLLLSLVFLFASIVFDKMHDYKFFFFIGISSKSFILLLEDGFKLLGIAGWFNYFFWTCLKQLTQSAEATHGVA